MPKTTTFASTTLDPDSFKDIYPPKIVNELLTRIVGGHLVITAIIGLCLNIFMFFHFLNSEKLSFYILCTSKTFSNALSLLVYLCYLGPIHLFYTSIGSEYFSTRLQQIFGFALFSQGPLTEMLITVNRFLVIMFTPTTIPKYSTHVTVVALAATWLGGVWWSTLPGYPDYCMIPFSIDHVGYYESDCNQQNVMILVFMIIGLAVFNNSMNIVLAIKLGISAKKLKGVSSEAAKNRRKQTVRFFTQSCIQDWLTAAVALNNILAISFYCKRHSCAILTTFATDSMSYATDGLLMFIFNYKRIKKPSVSDNFKRMDTVEDVSSTKVFTARNSIAN